MCSRGVSFVIVSSILALTFLSKGSSGGGGAPRGVHPELLSFYTSGQEFQCLDGKGVIPMDQVNDDYCDCDVSADSTSIKIV